MSIDSEMIYKFTQPNDYALKNLASNMICCRHYKDFNDPFEFWNDLYDGLPNYDDNDERFRAAISAWGFPEYKIHDLDLNKDSYIEYFGSLVEGAPVFSYIYDHARISCFSLDSESLLMWSHYADGLRGFCIEYDNKKLITEDEATFLTQVQYVEKPPIVDSLLYAVVEDQFFYAVDHGYEEYEGEKSRKILNEMMRKSLASKPLEWRYEREARLIIHTTEQDRNPFFYKYPTEAVKSVIIGERMEDSYKVAIKKILDTLPAQISIKIACRSKKDYNIKIKDFKL